MCRFIPLHLFDYLCKILIEIKFEDDEGNWLNKVWTLNKDEIGVAVQSCFIVGVELMAW